MGISGHTDNVYDIRGEEDDNSGVTTLRFKRSIAADPSDSWDRYATMVGNLTMG